MSYTVINIYNIQIFYCQMTMKRGSKCSVNEKIEYFAEGDRFFSFIYKKKNSKRTISQKLSTFGSRNPLQKPTCFSFSKVGEYMPFVEPQFLFLFLFFAFSFLFYIFPFLFHMDDMACSGTVNYIQTSFIEII